MQAGDLSKGAPPTAAEVATMLWGTRTVVKCVLVLLGVVAFLVLDFGTDIPTSLGGTPKQAGFTLAMMCFIPGFLLYFPLSWAASAWVQRLIRQRRG